jgi:hypothetical protein
MDVGASESPRVFDTLDEPASQPPAIQIISGSQIPSDAPGLDPQFPVSPSQDFTKIPCSHVDLESPDRDAPSPLYQPADNDQLLHPPSFKPTITNDFLWSVLFALIVCLLVSWLWGKYRARN